MDQPIQYFVTCAKGLEEAVVKELQGENIGATEIMSRASGVSFTGTLATGYSANLWLRSGIRVLAELARHYANTPEQLYERAKQIEWSRYMSVNQTLAVDARVWDSPQITHSKYAALKVKDAICDYFRAKQGSRPNVDVDNPDLPLFVYVHRDQAIFYRDMSGVTLHKRGYRDVMHKSSLNESIAAGILILADWHGQTPLVDPLCGSGTFAIEAALLAMNKAPGLFRKEFPFARWPDFDAAVWKKCQDDAAAKALPSLPHPICINDRHGGSVGLAQKDSQAAGVDKFIQFSQVDIADYRPPVHPGIVVANPPWGERIGDEDLIATWSSLGNFLRSQCKGAEAWILSGNKEVTRSLKLKSSRKFSLQIGQLECLVLKYEVW